MKPTAHPQPPLHTHGSAWRCLPWPLPALLVWALAWGCCVALPGAWGAAFGLLLGVLAGSAALSRMRQAVVGLGFPLSWLALNGLQAVAPWVWLLLAAVLALAYPLRAWSDAPLFPTPAKALGLLAAQVSLPPSASILDAGCGLGHGLRALRQAYPHACLHGVEWSRLWAWACRWRCPWAEVQRGDMWAQGWARHDLVYVFQRPESMARVMDKAARELRHGAWLVSLEFPALGWQPHAELAAGPGRSVWLYQQPFRAAQGAPQAGGESLAVPRR